MSSQGLGMATCSRPSVDTGSQILIVLCSYVVNKASSCDCIRKGLEM